MSGPESFSTVPLVDVVPSYLYVEYADDPDLQAFVDAYNTYAQGYLDWFNQTPLGVYTSPAINGTLLDWVGNGLYGIPRPSLSTLSTIYIAGINTAPLNAIALNTGQFISSGTSVIASDDIYKRVMTWNTYRGDGQVFDMQWLKNRIARFLNGTYGSDADVLDDPPNITVSGTVFSVTSPASSDYSSLQLCYSGGALAFPFLYTMEFA